MTSNYNDHITTDRTNAHVSGAQVHNNYETTGTGFANTASHPAPQHTHNDSTAYKNTEHGRSTNLDHDTMPTKATLPDKIVGQYLPSSTLFGVSTMAPNLTIIITGGIQAKVGHMTHNPAMEEKGIAKKVSYASLTRPGDD